MLPRVINILMGFCCTNAYLGFFLKLDIFHGKRKKDIFYGLKILLDIYPIFLTKKSKKMHKNYF